MLPLLTPLFPIAILRLQLLVLKLTLQLLRLGDLADRLVEVILVNCISVIFDGEQASVIHVSNQSSKMVRGRGRHTLQ